MFKKIFTSFLIWRLALFFVAFLSIYFIPVFGGRFPYADRVLTITQLPNWIWGFGNFDGVHYLRIAQDGYAAQYSQAFFPLYPFLIRIFSLLFPRAANLDIRFFTDPAYFYSGLILSNAFFLAALYYFYKLLRIDFNERTSFLSVIFLLIFPTSFFFGAVYSESLFLLLVVLAVYLIRKGSFFWGAVLIAFASATRVFGIFLIPLYLIEVFKSRNKLNYLWSLLTPAGILSYMWYLKVTFNNPLYFLTAQPIFGASRSVNDIVLLPQVIYRYIKIFLSVKILSLPFFISALEFLSVLISLTLLLVFFKKMRLSYWIFSICVLILPTLTGTFSSMPRYVLMSMIFLFPHLITGLGKYVKPIILGSSVLGIILTMLFVRGYWVA